jgi:predicted Zn-dependent protease
MSRRTPSCLVALVLALLTLMTPRPVFGQEVTPSENAALEAYRQGAFSRAVELYTNALSETQDPEHRARLHVNIAWTLFALGREGDVATHLRAALLEDPEFTLVSDYYTREFIDLFESARSGALAPAPDDGSPPPDLELTIASIQQRLDDGTDLEGALVDVDRLLRYFPGDGRLVPLRIQVLNRLGRTSEADRFAQTYGGGSTAVPLVESLSIPDLILRANRLLDEGDVTTSLELLREAVARQPSNVAALELMAEAAHRAAQWQEAEFALKSALALQPDNLGLKLRLGEVYLAKGQPSAARDVFRELTDRYPHADRAWASLGLLEAELGNLERADRYLKTALQENPLLPEVQLAYGELRLAAGEPDLALATFREATNLLRDDPQLQARMGQALLALGNDQEALQRLRAGVEGGFQPPDVRRALALAEVRNGRFAEAERLLGDLPADPEGDSDVVRAVLALETGAPIQAETLLRPIAETRAGEPEVLALLGASVYAQQRYPEAVVLLERAHELAPTDQRIERDLAAAVDARDAERLAAEARPAVRAASR